MEDYSRGYIGVQLPMDAKPQQVRFAVAAILTAFNLSADANDTSPSNDMLSGDGAVAAAPTGVVTPTPAAQVTPGAVAAAELDVDGLPWDARIHAGTKTKTQKKQWTRKKGIADATYDAVIAELRQQYPAAAAAPTPPAAPAAPIPPAAPAVTIPSAAAPTTPYQQFVDWLARNTGEGKSLPASWVEEQFKANNTTLAALATNQEASAQFLEAFRGVLKQMNVAEQ